MTDSFCGGLGYNKSEKIAWFDHSYVCFGNNVTLIDVDVASRYFVLVSAIFMPLANRRVALKDCVKAWLNQLHTAQYYVARKANGVPYYFHNYSGFYNNKI